jgi:CHAD domain-containing protein
MRQQVVAIRDCEGAVRLDHEDAVHKMRVAVRRLRSTLATYRRLLDEPRAERLRSELKWLGGVLGPVRDAEVIRRHIDTIVGNGATAADGASARQRAATTLGRQHDDAHRIAVAALSSRRYLALLDELDDLGSLVATERAGRPAKKELRKHVRRAHRRMGRAIDAALAHGDPTDEGLHDVRKAAKRVRYAAESVRDVYGPKAAELAAAMEGIQETLGDHQDTVVIRQVLHDLADEATAAGESAFVYGRLHAGEECRGTAARRAWVEAVEQRTFARPQWLR